MTTFLFELGGVTTLAACIDPSVNLQLRLFDVSCSLGGTRQCCPTYKYAQAHKSGQVLEQIPTYLILKTALVSINAVAIVYAACV